MPARTRRCPLTAATTGLTPVRNTPAASELEPGWRVEEPTRADFASQLFRVRSIISPERNRVKRSLGVGDGPMTECDVAATRSTRAQSAPAPPNMILDSRPHVPRATRPALCLNSRTEGAKP